MGLRWDSTWYRPVLIRGFVRLDRRGAVGWLGVGRVTNGDEGKEGTWTGLEEVVSGGCRGYLLYSRWS